MAQNKLGTRTFRPGQPVYIENWAAVAGKKEALGPLGHGFDIKSMDTKFGEQTWEQAEKKMQQLALGKLLQKARLKTGDIDLVFSGDLLNQCIGSSFSLRNTGIPHLGLYGACSTMAESLCIASMLVDGGYLQHALCTASSHFCTAERQYRMPVPYGSQRPPTAQWTATASGCTLLSAEGEGPYITHVCCGKIVDQGITDANNMGAAMAPAAFDTLSAFFRDTGTSPKDYDLVLTGDLGKLGREIVADLFQKSGVEMGENYQDCGLLLYDLEGQDMHAGASGCGCSAGVLNGYLLPGLRNGKWKRILFAPTGALLSPTSSFQGESIPGICHALCISAERG